MLDLAKSNVVTILTLPPHSTGKMKPLDVGIFKPFKNSYNTALDSWMMRNPGKPLTIYDVAACVGIAHEKALTPSIIISAFRKTRIYPYDRNIFTDDDFLPSQVTDRPFERHVTGENHQVNMIQSPGQPTTSTADPTSELCEPQASTSGMSTDFGTISVHKSPDKDRFLSPEQFRGYPKAKPRKSNKQGRKKGFQLILRKKMNWKFAKMPARKKRRGMQKKQ